MDTISIPTIQSQAILCADIGTCAQSEILAHSHNPAKLPSQSELRVLRLKEVTAKLGIAKSTIYDWLDSKSPRYNASFPKPFKLNSKSIGWLSNEIDAWLLAKIEQTTGVIPAQEQATSISQSLLAPSQASQPSPLLRPTEHRILRIKAVATKLGIGKSTIYDWLDSKSPRYDPSFPKPIKLSVKSIGWLSTAVDTWLLAKVEQSREKSLVS
ncbi:AlpA family phage regulatory protein [Entomomonas sp. E2T0]|uniref:helix-turn-helix transcriptional regulator n=1 Tax=Entomomonas sp. E2T0 TaxID=2930213 RepID=UPI002228443A|nr:AlpA family phage regulatory protein [Entomomonas sp. E2T0]UYZ84862.1 AlpA family phage regulatory protein [Entomomonas sp. E2T0]